MASALTQATTTSFASAVMAPRSRFSMSALSRTLCSRPCSSIATLRRSTGSCSRTSSSRSALSTSTSTSTRASSASDPICFLPFGGSRSSRRPRRALPPPKAATTTRSRTSSITMCLPRSRRGSTTSRPR
eukprot:Amastigsp_a2292_61.p3 type:complete len:130 gc:universal Amastigsp_a2292_61:232-621(+)